MYTSLKTILLATLLPLLFLSCPDDGINVTPPESDPTEFEQRPPLAEEVFLEILGNENSEGNVRIEAVFPKGSLARNRLEIGVGEDRVVLRDDGEGADLKKADGRFSAFIQDNPDLILQELSRKRDAFLENPDRLNIFEHRVRRKVDLEEIEAFDLKKLKAGTRFRIPKDLLLGGIAGIHDPERELLVRDVAVVEDPTRTFNPCSGAGNPNGIWTFGHLMRQMASTGPASIATDAQASDFVMDWLETWTVAQTVNGEVIDARNNIQTEIINPWLATSSANGAPAGELKMELAPFKLTAIVNRVDLRGNSGYGVSDAGEGRLVFCALTSSCSPRDFNVIFEYGLNKRTCPSLRNYAEEWSDLGAMTLGSPTYNQALEDITLQFTEAGTFPSRPNENSINQIRTNEVILTLPWELREFNLSTAGVLVPVTVKMEPAVKYNAKVSNADVDRLRDFINNNQVAIANNQYSVPEQLPVVTGTPTPTTGFLGGKSQTKFPPSGTSGAHHWDAVPGDILDDAARHRFSLNTCSGCHGGEAQVFFTHIDPASFGSAAGLSGFLTGMAGNSETDFGVASDGVMTVRDPAGRPGGAPAMRDFNDLERRAQDLENLLSRTCGFRPGIFVGDFVLMEDRPIVLGAVSLQLAHLLTFDPIRMTH